MGADKYFTLKKVEKILQQRNDKSKKMANTISNILEHKPMDAREDENAAEEDLKGDTKKDDQHGDA